MIKFEMTKNIGSSVVLIAVAIFTIQCVGLTNCNIFCSEQIPLICDCHRNTTTSISIRCKNKGLKGYPHFGDAKVYLQTIRGLITNILTRITGIFVQKFVAINTTTGCVF